MTEPNPYLGKLLSTRACQTLPKRKKPDCRVGSRKKERTTYWNNDSTPKEHSKTTGKILCFTDCTTLENCTQSFTADEKLQLDAICANAENAARHNNMSAEYCRINRKAEIPNPNSENALIRSRQQRDPSQILGYVFLISGE